MPAPRRSRRLALATVAGIALLAAGALAWRAVRPDLVFGAPLVSGETPVQLTIAGERLTIPAERLRFADQRRPGEYPRVELELKWPGLLPLKDNDPAAKTTARDGELVFITIEARETDLDTADRIETIYQKFLSGDQTGDAAPNGLVRRRFLAGTAYDGEDLYFEPGSVHPFATRCFAIDKGEPPISCLTDERLGSHLMATIRFPIRALADWRTLRDRTDQMFHEMTGGGSG
jgi:hypothetical protein